MPFYAFEGWEVQITGGQKNVLHRIVKSMGRDGMAVAEVGCWLGESTAVIAGVVSRFGGMLYCIDHWKGNDNVQHPNSLYDIASRIDVYAFFEKNMREEGVWESIRVVRRPSPDAADEFPDGFFDLVYVDANHAYSSVSRDIEAWLPKVKQGGILCGHDCERYFGDMTDEEKEAVATHSEEDYVFGIHPGVILSVWERFASKFSIEEHIWVAQKEFA